MVYFFHSAAPYVIYTLSLHDALPISIKRVAIMHEDGNFGTTMGNHVEAFAGKMRSEEHTSELQSQFHLVCRLLLEKKNDSIRGYSPHADVELRRRAYLFSASEHKRQI